MAHTEKRTQIYLSEELHLGVMEYARGQNMSFSSVVREALESYLRSRGEAQTDWTGDPAQAIIGQIELPELPANESLDEAIDRSLYDP